MIRILHVDVDHISNESCAPTHDDPNGRFPNVTIEFTSGNPLFTETLMGKTCACGRGHKTYKTWRLPSENMLFESKEALLHYLNMDDEYASSHKVDARLDPAAVSQYW